jgi:hypothetical protein
MPQSLADRTNPEALAAAMSRHPAAGVRATVSTMFGAASTAGRPASAAREAASFATVAALLTGPWRVNDPVAFAAAMRAAPLVAGFPVVDLAACARQPTAGLDPLSAAAAGHLESAVGAAAARSGLAVRWVAARGGSDLFVEAAARARADAEGPELLVLAHLVEPVPAGGAFPRPPVVDDSWVVVVVGDGRGGVAGIGRASLAPAWPGSGDRSAARLGLGRLRARLAGAARAAEGLEGSDGAAEGVVLPFRR